MTDLIKFEAEDGSYLVVESDERVAGPPVPVNRGKKLAVAASTTLEDALQHSLPALRRITEAVQSVAPDEYEVEFGLKLDAEAGAVIAKTGVSGHFTVRLGWKEPAP